MGNMNGIDYRGKLKFQMDKVKRTNSLDWLCYHNTSYWRKYTVSDKHPIDSNV